MNLVFESKPILTLAKAQSAMMRLSSGTESYMITDDNNALLLASLAVGYMNLCGKLLQYIDKFHLEELESGRLEITLHSGITHAPAPAVHSAAEQYLTFYILKEFYAAAGFKEVSSHFEREYRTATRLLLQLLAL